jgi:hypothetical protein
MRKLKRKRWTDLKESRNRKRKGKRKKKRKRESQQGRETEAEGRVNCKKVKKKASRICYDVSKIKNML